MDAIERGDALEASLVARLGEIYADALRSAIKKKAAFLRKIKDVDEGRIKPPKHYVDTGQVDKWRQGYIRKLMRQENVIDGIMDELNKAGSDAAEIIQETLSEYYDLNESEIVEKITSGMKSSGFRGKLNRHTKEQIKVILQEEESPFSRLAYQNIRRNPAIRRRLQNDLAQATILGESQQEIIKRIRAATGQAVWQAKRVAQTERTRVQSQARWAVGNEAAEMGIRVVNKWSARMVNTRDTHAMLNNQYAMQGEYFHGSPLRYPGDPTAPANEVINCHCVLVPDILEENQVIIDGRMVRR